MRTAKKAVSVLLALCLILALALPALAESTQTQAQLPADLVAMVKSLDRAQLYALVKLVQEQLKATAPVEFAGVVTQVSGDTFTVAKGGKGSQVTKTFTVTANTKIVGEGKQKGAAAIKVGATVKVKADANGNALTVQVLPAKKVEALVKSKIQSKQQKKTGNKR